MRAHNLEVVRRRVTAGGQTTDATCLKILQELGEFVLSWIEGKKYTYENQTYNLTDSTGCGVYEKGRLVSFYYAPQRATKPKRFVWKKKERNEMIYGRRLLEAALNNEGTTLTSAYSYSLRVFSMAPYGVFVNDGTGYGSRGKGWFDDLKDATQEKFNELRNGTRR